MASAWASVAGQIETSRRRELLSWSHHAEVAEPFLESFFAEFLICNFWPEDSQLSCGGSWLLGIAFKTTLAQQGDEAYSPGPLGPCPPPVGPEAHRYAEIFSKRTKKARSRAGRHGAIRQRAGLAEGWESGDDIGVGLP